MSPGARRYPVRAGTDPARFRRRPTAPPPMAAPTAAPRPPAVTGDGRRMLEDPCPDCGEGVRRGLVRCWNCGAFMRPDLAARYAEMSRDHAEVAFNPLPEIDGTGPGGGRGHVESAPEAAAADDAFGDFELSGDFGEDASAEEFDDFELTGEFSVPRAGDHADRADAPAPPAPPAAAKAEKASKDAATKDGAADPAADPGPTAETPAAPAPTAAEEAEARAADGDALLDIALKEEKKLLRGKGLVVTDEAFLLRCPAGHPIKVKRKHAGKLGRCPRPDCRLRYLVPEEPPEVANAGGDTAEIPAAADRDPLAAGPFARWIDGATLHEVDPAKVKKKAGSLEKGGVPADLALSPECLLVLSLKGKPGRFGLGGEKPEDVREKDRAHLDVDGARLTDLPGEHLVISGANCGELSVDYPPAHEHDSAFGDVPVFGEGKIAVKLPALGGEGGPARYLALTLTQFRRFAAALAQFGFVPDLAAGTPVPMTDEPAEHAGHDTDAVVHELPRPDLYRADPALEIAVSGYRCGSCGLVVSEDGRKKEKLGGANGKGLAKAKCPECDKPFGENPLYGLKTSPTS